MATSPPNILLSVSNRIYRALLVAYPARFREDYGPHMAQVFRDCCRDAQRQRGTSGVIGQWLYALGDLALTALAERISERRHWDMSSPQLFFWTGFASIAGGGLWMMLTFAGESGGLLFVFAILLSLGGLVGLHARQAKQAGWLGWAGFLLGLIGYTLALLVIVLGLGPSSEIPIPVAAPRYFLLSAGMGVAGAGLVFLSLVTLRAKTLTRWRALPLCLGLLYVVLALFMVWTVVIPLTQGQNPFQPWESSKVYNLLAVGGVLFFLIGVGWIGLGFTLMEDSDKVVAQTPPASA